MRKSLNIKFYIRFIIIICFCLFIKIDIVKTFTLPTSCKNNSCGYTRADSGCWICPSSSNYANSYLRKNTIQVSSMWPGADSSNGSDKVNVKISTNVDNKNYRVFCLEKGKSAPYGEYTYVGSIKGKAACAAINFLSEDIIKGFKSGSRSKYLINPGTTNYVKIQKYVWRIISHRSDNSWEKYSTSSCDKQVFGYKKHSLKLTNNGGTDDSCSYKGKVDLNKNTGSEITKITTTIGRTSTSKSVSESNKEVTIKDIKFTVAGDKLNIEIPCEKAESMNLTNFKVKIESSDGSVIRPVIDIYNSNGGAQDVGLIYFGVSKANVKDELDVTINLELTPCEIDLNNLLKTSTSTNLKLGLIELYKKYSNEKYNGLLNFSNPTCAVVSDNVNPTNACLEADYSVDFSSENVSNFDTAKLDVESTFCKLNYNIENIMQDSKYSLKSGMLMYFNLEDMPIMNATIVEKCYSYGNSETNSFSNLANVITDVKLDEINLSVNLSELPIQSNPIGNGITEHTKEIKISYNLPLIHAVTGTGEIVDEKNYKEKCSVEDEGNNYFICQKIGRGIPTKFTDDQVSKIIFSYKFNGEVQTADCEYNIKREIVKCDDTKENCNLNLEFRTINTKFGDTAFLDKYGDIRAPGQNWCTAIKNRVIETRNDSTGKKGKEPLYTIELTLDKIKEIRKYNKDKKNSYDTPLYCSEEGICESQFLKEKFPDLQRRTDLQWETDFNTMLYGDVNLDGAIDMFDATAINLYLKGYSYSNECKVFSKELSDVNEDGIIDEEDPKIIQNFQVGNKTGIVGEPYKK